MDLIQIRDGLSLSLIFVASLAILFGGGSSPLIFGLFAVCCAFAFCSPRLFPSLRIVPSSWTVIVTLGLIGSVARAWYLRDILDSGLEFILLLIVQRIFHRQRVREHLQLLLLTSILMILAAIINTELSYPILLAIYLPLATLTMMINLVLAEVDRLQLNTLSNPWSKPQEQWRTLARASIGVSVIAGLTGMVVFVATPRVGVGVFLRGSINQDPVSGFSDAVTLGGFGRIRTDQQIIMRMTPVGELNQAKYLPIYMRGSAFDHYQSGSWSHSQFALRSPLTRKGGFYQLPSMNLSANRNARTLRMTVTLEDIGSDLLFAASPALGVALYAHNLLEARNRVYGGVDGQFVVIGRQPGPIRYEFLSLQSEASTQELKGIPTSSDSPDLSPYLQTLNSRSDRIHHLALELTRHAPTQLAKINAIMQYLGQFTYTLDLPNISTGDSDIEDPIETFLFSTKQGHCEYFATAMALLLREIGIPTRNVNGFFGASWNEIGKYYFVRQSNAHSWVEVYFESYGWVRFDPTPPSSRTRPDLGSSEKLSQWIDALHNQYLNWVVDFDLAKQRQIFLEIGKSDSKSTKFHFSWQHPIVWISAAAGLGFASYWLRRRRSPPLPAHQRLQQRLNDKLREFGFEASQDESTRCFARRVMEKHPEIREALHEFIGIYETLRFSDSFTQPSAEMHPCIGPERSPETRPSMRRELLNNSRQNHDSRQYEGQTVRLHQLLSQIIQILSVRSR